MKFSNKLLSEVAFFQEGPGVRKYQFRNEGVKLLNVGNINKGVLDTSTTKLYISEEEAYGKYKHFLVDEGDLLIASSGIVVDNFHNKIAYVKKEHLPLCLNTSTIRFKTLDENVFSLDYLKFYLKTTHFKNQLRKLITGAAQLNFGPSHLKKITLPVPTLPDQLHIANLLSKAENLIAQRKESIRLLDEFLKSTFLEMFGDPVRNEKGIPKSKIITLTNIGTGGTPSRKREAEFYNGKIPWVKTTEVNGSYISNTEEKITEAALKESNCKMYPVGTILIAMYGQGKTRGNVGVLKIEATTNQACAAILPSNNFNTIFLFQQLKQLYTSIRSMAKGSNQENLNLSIVGNIEILIPPLELQTQFAHIVEKTEALKTQYQQSLQELENLYGSLSQKAFRGELGVKQNNSVTV